MKIINHPLKNGETDSDPLAIRVKILMLVMLWLKIKKSDTKKISI